MFRVWATFVLVQRPKMSAALDWLSWLSLDPIDQSQATANLVCCSSTNIAWKLDVVNDIHNVPDVQVGLTEVPMPASVPRPRRSRTRSARARCPPAGPPARGTPTVPATASAAWVLHSEYFRAVPLNIFKKNTAASRLLWLITRDIFHLMFALCPHFSPPPHRGDDAAVRGRSWLTALNFRAGARKVCNCWPICSNLYLLVWGTRTLTRFMFN